MTLVLGEPDGIRLTLDPLGAGWRRLDVPTAGGPRQVLLTEAGPSGEPLPGFLNLLVGRYANRIAGGRFDLDGATYDVDRNDRGHHLHGGRAGFSNRTWDVVDHSGCTAALRLADPAGGGYPGRLDVLLEVGVTAGSVWTTTTATTDAPTLCNPTQHPYFRLHDGPVDDHRLTVYADRYLPVDERGIPVGDPAPVDGTPYDLRRGDPIGERALDHDYWLSNGTAATLVSGDGGLALDVRTDRPGLQVFTEPGRRAVALETQLHPDSPHHPDWPSAVLRPGQTYRSTTTWRFREG